MNLGSMIVFSVPMVLAVMAWRRQDGTLQKSLVRWAEQLAQILPTMAMAMLAAGFFAAMIPDEIISRYLGGDSPVLGVLIGSVAGLLFPTGPVVVFSLSASFALAGASTSALVAFVTSWTLFALHRMVIYEIPLLGPSFVIVRVLSILSIPFIAGFLTIGVEFLISTLILGSTP